MPRERSRSRFRQRYRGRADSRDRDARAPVSRRRRDSRDRRSRTRERGRNSRDGGGSDGRDGRRDDSLKRSGRGNNRGDDRGRRDRTRSRTPARSRSRTPPRLSDELVAAFPNLESFLKESGVDSAARGRLLAQPHDVIRKVLAQGELAGRNSSSVLLARIKQHQSTEGKEATGGGGEGGDGGGEGGNGGVKEGDSGGGGSGDGGGSTAAEDSAPAPEPAETQEKHPPEPKATEGSSEVSKAAETTLALACPNLGSLAEDGELAALLSDLRQAGAAAVAVAAQAAELSKEVSLRAPLDESKFPIDDGMATERKKIQDSLKNIERLALSMSTGDEARKRRHGWQDVESGPFVIPSKELSNVTSTKAGPSVPGLLGRAHLVQSPRPNQIRPGGKALVRPPLSQVLVPLRPTNTILRPVRGVMGLTPCREALPPGPLLHGVVRPPPRPRTGVFLDEPKTQSPQQLLSPGAKAQMAAAAARDIAANHMQQAEAEALAAAQKQAEVVKENGTVLEMHAQAERQLLALCSTAETWPELEGGSDQNQGLSL